MPHVSRIIGRSLFSSYIFLMGIMLALPLVLVVLVSFDTSSYIKFPPEGFHLKWYYMVFKNELFMHSLVNSIIVAVVSTAVATILAVPAAFVIARRKFRGREAIYSILLSSLTVPWIVLGLALLFLWGSLGLRLSMWTLIFGHTVVAAPYIVRTCTAVLASAAPSYEQAARTLGANARQTFFLVTIPIMRPGIVAGASFAFILSFINIPISLFITTADNVTAPIAIFSYMSNNFDPGVAAFAVIQLIFILAVIYLASDGARLR